MSNRPSKKPLPSQRVNAAHDQAQRSRTIWIIAGVALAIVFALVVTIALSAGGDDKGTDTAGQSKGAAGTVVPAGDIDYGTVTVDGTPLPPQTQGGADTAVGEAVPTITGQQFDGAPITIGGTSSGGKPSIILGIAHWCPHCQKEVPLIQGWIDENGMPSDVTLQAVSTSANDTRPNWPADAWLVKEGWTIPTLVDDAGGTAAGALGLSGFPYMLVVDKDGNVIYRTSGEKTVAQWEALLESARTGQPPTS